MSDDSTEAHVETGAGGQGHDVFISYGGADKETAELVCAALERAGVRCWIAPRNTLAGAYGRSIMEAIKAARMLVLVLSPHSDKSPNVLTEVAEAFDRKLPLIPFRLSEFVVSDELRFYIRTQHWVDAFPKPVEGHIPALLDRVKARLAPAASVRRADKDIPSRPPGDTGAERALEKPAAAEPPRARTRRRTWLVSGAAAALVLAVAAGLYLGMRPAPAPDTVTDKAPGETPLPKGAFRDCPECPELLAVPAGKFTMGSPAAERERDATEGPQREVIFAKPFALGKYPVTFEEYDACAATGACAYRPPDNGWGRGRQPVVQASWDDAKAYVAWLAKKTGKAYRLPSEAEWEYAARAGTATRYFWGDEIGRGRAACAGCGSQWDSKQPAPAGSFAANAFGLHDMHGNIWQWLEDCWHDSYQGAAADGRAWAASGECKQRALRGGGFFSFPKSLRSAARYHYEPKGRLGNIGLRVARDLD